MTIRDWKGCVVVVDLDDTIYSECDYRRSGIDALCSFVRSHYPGRPEFDVDELLLEAPDDPVGAICRALQLRESVKESLIWFYRLHAPSIQLSEDVRRTIVQMEAVCQNLVILTDGRSVTQRLKIHALGLDHLDIFISEEYGSEKPEPMRFLQIMKDYPASKYVYVGDNPAKDFIAPRRLGWSTIGVRSNGVNIHSQAIDATVSELHPDIWIDSFKSLMA